MNDSQKIDLLETKLSESRENLKRLIDLLSSNKPINANDFLDMAKNSLDTEVQDVVFKEVPLTPASNGPASNGPASNSIESNKDNDTNTNTTTNNANRIEPTLNDREDVNMKETSTNNLSFDEDIQVASYSKQKNKEKFSSFKNMIASSFVKFTNEYGFKNQNTDWYSLGKKVGMVFSAKKDSANKNLSVLLEVFNEVANKTNVAFTITKEVATNVKQVTESAYETVTLVGSKRKIKTLQKRFSSVLDILGFEAAELYADAHKNTYISMSQVESNLDNSLEKIKFSKKDGKYVNDFLKDVNEESKATMIYSVIWPNLAEKIHQGVALTTEISNFQKENKYLKIITNFARKNNLSSEDVTNVLMADKNIDDQNHIFAKKKDFSKLKENIADIVENVEKFTALANNNALFITNIVKATEDLKETIVTLEIDNKRKMQLLKAIDESVVFTDNKNNTYKYITIKNNIAQIMLKDNAQNGIKADAKESLNQESTTVKEVLERKASIDTTHSNETKDDVSMKP